MAIITSEITMIYRRMCRIEAPGHDRPSSLVVGSRTLIGGSAHQTRNASDLSELLVIASDHTGCLLLASRF
jgi:hypothetical protein